MKVTYEGHLGDDGYFHIKSFFITPRGTVYPGPQISLTHEEVFCLSQIICGLRLKPPEEQK